MKKLFIPLLIFVFVLSASGAYAAGKVIYDRSTTQNSVSDMFSCITYTNGTTYIFTLNANGFLAISDEGVTTEYTWAEDTVVSYGEDTLLVQTAVAHEGTLYVLCVRYRQDVEDNTVRIRGAFLYEVVLDQESQTADFGERIKLDWDDMIDDFDDTEYSRSTSPPIIQDGKLLFTTYGQSGTLEIMVYDLETGDAEPMNIENLSGIASYKDGAALIQICDFNSSPARYTFSALDLDTGSITELVGYDMPDMVYPTDFCYDEASGNFYYRMSGELWVAPGMMIEKARSIGVASGYGSYYAQPTITDDGYLLMSDVDFVIKYNPDPDARSERTIKVTDWGYITQECSRVFSDRHPDVDVIRSVDESGIVEAMMNRSSDMDVYCVSMDSPDYRAIYDRGFMADLSSSEILTGLVGEMYKGITKSVIKDGKLLALPVNIYSKVFGYYHKGFEAIGLSPDDAPKTWVEFFALLNDLPDVVDDYDNIVLFDRTSSVSEMRLSILEAMLSGYMLYLGSDEAAGVSFDSPVLRDILSAFDQIDFSKMDLPESGDSYEYADIDEQAMFTSWAMLSASTPYIFNIEEPMTLALSEDIPPLVQAEVTVMFVNPFSKNLPLAIEFVECAAERLDDMFLTNICPGRNEPIESPYAQSLIEETNKSIADMEAALEKADEDSAIVIQSNIKALKKEIEDFEIMGKYIATNESIANYRKKAESQRTGADLAIDIKSSPEISTAIRQYADGAINADTLIRNIDQRLRMMMLEGM